MTELRRHTPLKPENVGSLDRFVDVFGVDPSVARSDQIVSLIRHRFNRYNEFRRGFDTLDNGDSGHGAVLGRVGVDNKDDYDTKGREVFVALMDSVEAAGSYVEEDLRFIGALASYPYSDKNFDATVDTFPTSETGGFLSVTSHQRDILKGVITIRPQAK